MRLVEVSIDIGEAPQLKAEDGSVRGWLEYDPDTGAVSFHVDDSEAAINLLADENS